MSKYNSKKVTVNGMTFDSKKEYNRYCELSLLQKAGIITDLQRQVKFVLVPKQAETFDRYSEKTGKRLKDGTRTIESEVSYIADFTYNKDGKQVVEDVKGYRKGQAYALFSIKRKLMLWVHGIQVKET